MGLDYGWTCGSIDDNIKDFKSILEYEISSILDDACPLLEGEQKTDFIADYVKAIYEQSQNIFEDLRECNSDMRKEADSQIDKLEEEKEQLEYEVSNHQERIDELEDENEELQNRIAF